MKYSILMFFCTIAVLINGCQSDRYFQDQAATRAREYLISHAPELTPQEVHFIRFNDPMLLTGDVIGSKDFTKRPNETTRTEQRQICVSWKLPNRKELYMVYGVSTSRMDNWSPVRLIKKRALQNLKAIISTTAIARNYALNHLREQLPAAGYNRIRFSEPEIIPTKFELNFNPYGKLSKLDVEKARQAAEKQYQFSVVWPLDDEKAVVLTGLALDENLTGWSVNFGGVLVFKEIEYKTRPKEIK